MRAAGHGPSALSLMRDGNYLSPMVGREWEAEKRKYAAPPPPQPQPQPLTDAELARIAYKGYDDYWTDDSKGIESEAWAASARAVLAAQQEQKP
jgi:hypothetical protein